MSNRGHAWPPNVRKRAENRARVPMTEVTEGHEWPATGATGVRQARLQCVSYLTGDIWLMTD